MVPWKAVGCSAGVSRACFPARGKSRALEQKCRQGSLGNCLGEQPTRYVLVHKTDQIHVTWIFSFCLKEMARKCHRRVMKQCIRDEGCDIFFFPQADVKSHQRARNTMSALCSHGAMGMNLPTMHCTEDVNVRKAGC